jgi:hypothetical protein
MGEKNGSLTTIVTDLLTEPPTMDEFLRGRSRRRDAQPFYLLNDGECSSKGCCRLPSKSQKLMIG